MSDAGSHFHTVENASIPCEGGRLEFVTAKSDTLKGRGDVTLYIPDQAQGNPNTPVVILLHGVYCSHWAWALKGNAHLGLQGLIDKGEVPPMILAMPSDGLWGDGSGYFAHSGKDFEKWIVEEIPLLVSEITDNSIDAPHFICGLSMGGFGAMRLGARYPERFKAFSGHSSVTEFKDLAEFMEEPMDSYGNFDWDRLTLLSAIIENRENIVPFRFDCGVDDALLESNRLLASSLEEEKIQFIYEEFPGGHEWPYWEEHVLRSYRFFAEQL